MLVSLMISTYNWKEALSLCLYSAFAQTVKPCEILIADDGSRDDTKQLIDKMRTKTDIPIVHVWHEDKGFRLSAIRISQLLFVYLHIDLFTIQYFYE